MAYMTPPAAYQPLVRHGLAVLWLVGTATTAQGAHYQFQIYL